MFRALLEGTTPDWVQAADLEKKIEVVKASENYAEVQQAMMAEPGNAIDEALKNIDQNYYTELLNVRRDDGKPLFKVAGLASEENKATEQTVLSWDRWMFGNSIYDAVTGKYVDKYEPSATEISAALQQHDAVANEKVVRWRFPEIAAPPPISKDRITAFTSLNGTPLDASVKRCGTAYEIDYNNPVPAEVLAAGWQYLNMVAEPVRYTPIRISDTQIAELTARSQSTKSSLSKKEVKKRQQQKKHRRKHRG